MLRKCLKRKRVCGYMQSDSNCLDTVTSAIPSLGSESRLFLAFCADGMWQTGFSLSASICISDLSGWL